MGKSYDLPPVSDSKHEEWKNGDLSNGTSTHNGVSIPNDDELPPYDRATNTNGVTILPKYADHDPDNYNKEQPNDGKEEKPKAKKLVGFFQLFRFADGLDKVLMIVGTLASIAVGVAFPLNLLVYGQVANLFINDSISASGMNASMAANMTRPDIFNQVSSLSLYFVYIAFGVLICAYMEIAFWTWTAERQTRRIRARVFHSILRQDISWFDTHDVGELNTRLADDITKIHDGIGDKFATFVQWMSTFFAGYILGFILGWKLTLVILALSPLIVLGGGAVGRIMGVFTHKEQQAYAKAGSVAEEVLGNIRTVAAFSGEKKECERYNSNLVAARAVGVKKGLVSGAGIGFVWIVIFGTFALSFWYGAKLVRDGEEGYTGGTILQVFMGVLIGSMSLGHAAPNFENFASARGAATAIFEIIDHEPEIDSSSEEGEKPEKIEGNVEFKDVKFNYPTRPDVNVLTGLDLHINVGSTVALVGASGCGKSTTVQLLQRFYDPFAGKICIDGVDIKDLNPRWLRQQIGVVSQEPILFATTIAENVRYGREGVTQAEIEQAAQEANAHDFIMKLPDKYETLVGERGAQLSGGQKQRVAIARALVRDPRILLLDEATSALDNESEGIVQTALDKARLGRTTLVIAHRLSTIQNADEIVGLADGKVVERGSHAELMEKQGLYYQLVMHQTHIDEDEEEEEIMSLTADLDEENVADQDILRAPSKLSREFSSRGSIRKSQDLIRKGSGRKQHVTLSRPMSAEEEKITIERQEKELEETLPEPSLKRIMRMNAPEWPYIILGCLAAIVTGAIHPAFAIMFSEIIGIFAETDFEKQARLSAMYAAIVAGLGFGAALCNFIQHYFFAVAGEKLTMRLRELAFKAMLRQEIGWFDDHKNQVGALTTRLASDASMVKGATGSRLAVVVQSIANIGVAIVISLVSGWKLALVVMCFLPILILSGAVQTRLYQGLANSDKEALEEGGKVATEAIENIRTVASLTKEEQFEARFNADFTKIYKDGRRGSHIYGITYGICQAVVFFAYAAAFSYGAYLVQQGEMQFAMVFRVMMCIVFGGQSAGRMSSFSPDYKKAKLSAAKLFALYDREPAIGASEVAGRSLEKYEGDLTFEDVRFRYPTRPDVQVLDGLFLRVKPGQSLALVGSSGCGKSTAIQLIERFYDSDSGTVSFGGSDVKELNLQWLRQQIGLVSQEPVLFDTSIAENIAYGDNSRPVTMDEIIEAAKKSNIHKFISELPLGYETNVGDKGAQLSGGQKQRVAIARALIRNPKVLLLDEATSALDTESEKIVQEALDKAQKGRTCIMIAHRLSTIQNADTIAIIRHGHVTELGSHSELMALQGFYYTLHQVSKGRKGGPEISVIN
ncbi:unnamed protein product [Owenia fusiformis]|uniref:ATP-binding cassette sub-family B member 5 n=1 Tax=Owenia fusiformis TaxID=6347 RepID=A0A8J1YCP1_OWEFU|nr:unnamed protein product [Owenia fusiformis]